MRVAVATDQWFPDFKGGAARVATDTALLLADRGHEVTVLAPRAAGKPRESSRGSLRVVRALARGALPQTVTDVFETRRHARRLRAADFDVLLAHQPTTAVGLTSAFPTTPLTLVYHASALRELRIVRARLPFGLRRLSTYPLEPPLALAEKRAVRRAATILVLSEYSRSLVVADHPEAAQRVVRVRGGVDTDLFAPAVDRADVRRKLGVPDETSLLLTVRRLEPGLGLEELLHAVCIVRPANELVLVVGGGGQLDGSLRSLARELGLEAVVRFVGPLEQRDLVDWYRAADLFVLPSARHEGFGIATAEALACGTPVVGTPTGATPELLRPLDPSLVARDASPDALAAAISASLALADGDFRSRCRDYARRELGWAEVIPAWEECLERAASGGRRFAAVG